MIEPTILSRPTYGTLEPRPGRAHLLIADDAGSAAIVDLFARAPADFHESATILSVTKDLSGDEAAALHRLSPATLTACPDMPAMLNTLAGLLAEAGMGVQIYLAGTEPLIGQAMRVVIEAGIDHSAIATEHRGSLARRVQCVHCKGFMDEVTTQPVTCAHCGLSLFVRDHYSRRLAAFQGVCINAEDQSEIVPAEEVFR
ncbi:dimethylamine monooxygenase subunit DmmA family protein [Methylobrevis pamukkalensis]|uniref:Uncharacterized protein n=1 Tax=Methylobrevis pamukkalensis TaxID=1439726 RepID=A0A1E3H5R0_9HYPH|nr:dimethylamine monooxygenase subunit DmmA family protein [Methylobrevis pamukkalensis]ODN71657.1 hypothetical protein A6302_00994 [Methylobrevis pamukkalensis]